MRWYVGLLRCRNGWKFVQVEWANNVLMVVPVAGLVFGVMRHINVDSTGSWSVFIGPLQVEWCWRIKG